MQKQGLRRTFVTASALVMLASAAYAQDDGKFLTQTIPESVARSVMKGAVGAEKRLSALPSETYAAPAKTDLEALPELRAGNRGGKAVAAADVSTDAGIGTENYGCAPTPSPAGCPPTNLNTVYHYNDSRLDPIVVPNYPYRTSGYFLHTFNGTELLLLHRDADQQVDPRDGRALRL